MVAKAEIGVSNKLDTFKLVIAVAVLLAGIAGFYFYAEESLLYRVLGLLVLVGIAVGIIYTTQMGRSIVGFGREARAEVRKVVWPTGQETVQTTIMVVAPCIVLGIFMWVVDYILLKAVQLLTGQG